MATLSDNQIAALAIASGFPGDQIATAVAVALAESGGRTDVISPTNSDGSHDVGVWQINSVHGYSDAAMQDPAQNGQAAHKIWADAGNSWTPWSTFNNGTYIAFMGRGSAGAANPDKNGINTHGFPGASASASADAATSALTSITSSLKAIVNPGMWLRVGAFLGGLAIMLLGAMKMGSTNKTVVQLVKDGTKAAVDYAAVA